MNIKLEIKKLTKTDKFNIALRNIFNIYLFNLKIKILINWKNNTNNFIRNFNLYKQYFIFSEFDKIEFNSDSYIDSGSDSNSHSDFDSDSNSSNEEKIFINEFSKYDIMEYSSDDNNLHDNISESDSDIDLDFEKIDNIDLK